MEDTRNWLGTGDDVFDVKDTYSKFRLREDSPLVESLNLVWSMAIPSKVSAFIWKAAFDRLLMKSNLRTRRIVILLNNLFCVPFASRINYSIIILL